MFYYIILFAKTHDLFPPRKKMFSPIPPNRTNIAYRVAL
uniref:Uncharacterized protein n=1 Tax=Siphoviridae sp. ctFBb37 TaxID=2827565 RepID=A0A8S5RS55_9CAUD|nr:MAG TPA: hypothetical protein [Siphoviridae sp. ctFBb37]